MAELTFFRERLEYDGGQVGRALLCDPVCHPKSGHSSRKDHLKHLIQSHRNEGPSLYLIS